MKRFIIICSLLASMSTLAAEAVVSYSTKNGDLLVLIDAPCTATLGAFASMPADIRPEFKAAALRWEGQVLEACWALAPSGEHLIVDQTGDAGFVEGGPFLPQGEAL